MAGIPDRVLLVTPHPDDAEGGCGGTVAGWIKGGAEVVYLICTNGDKGTSDPGMSMEQIATIREQEQLEAAKVLGVKDVVFLRHPDGGLEDSRQFRCGVVREIRRHRPDVVMWMDPHMTGRHSHRDHRVSAQVTVDAVCTYSWRRLYFPEHVTKEGLQPHAVREIYFWGSEEPNTFIDIGETIELKALTLSKHASQFSDPDMPRMHVYARARDVGETCNLTYAERFKVVSFIPDPLVVG